MEYLFLSFFLTIIVYLFFPLLFIIIGKKRTQTQLISITVLNGLFVYIMFIVTGQSVSDSLPNISAAVIWSLVSYLLMNKLLLAPKYVYDAEKLTKSSFAPYFSGKRFQLSVLFLGILVSVLFWLNVRQGFGSIRMQSEYSTLISEAQTEYYNTGYNKGYEQGYSEAASNLDTTNSDGYNEGYTDARIELLKNFVLEEDYNICWWDFSGMYHRDIRCSYIDSVENVVPALKSDMEESGVKPCFICY